MKLNSRKKTRNNLGLPENEFGLTEKQELFAQAYVATLNAAQSAIEAKLGNNYNSSAAIGYEYLRNPQIQKRIVALRRQTEKDWNGIKEKLIEKLMAMADLDMSQMYDKNGNLLPPSKWPADLRQSINAVETRHLPGELGKVNKIKTESKTKAIELLARFQGYFAPEKAPVDDEGKPVIPIININTVKPSDG